MAAFRRTYAEGKRFDAQTMAEVLIRYESLKDGGDDKVSTVEEVSL